MIFWLVCILLTVAVVAMTAAPLLRTSVVPDENPDVTVYRAQLGEIERDLERDVLAPDEAELARAEVARRLLAASKAQTVPVQTSVGSFTVPVLIGAVVLGLSFYLYQSLGAPGYGDMPLKARIAASDEMRANRPSQAALEAATPAPPPVDLPDEYREAITQLRIIAPTRPDDLEVWSRLVFHEVELRNYAGAARAQAHMIAIRDADATLLDRQRLLDLTVAAAGGFVSPEAETLIVQIMTTDDQNLAARYYLGALYNQTDRPDLAFRFWRSLVETGDPSNFHVAVAREQISDAAYRAGIEYALPEARGPSFEDMDAASELSPQAQQEMIGGMVAGLADRLANEGGPAQDWARLIRAYGVLGEQEAARAVWEEAQQVFVSSMRGMEILTSAARDAGVLE